MPRNSSSEWRTRTRVYSLACEAWNSRTRRPLTNNSNVPGSPASQARSPADSSSRVHWPEGESCDAWRAMEGSQLPRPPRFRAARALADHVAEIDDTGDPPRLDVGQHRFQCGDVAVHVGDDGNPVEHVSSVSAGHRVGYMVAGRKVLLLAADDFEDMELLYPLYRLIEEDVAGTVAGLDDHPVTGKKGHGPVPVDTTADQVAEADFDALIIPGGYAPDKLRRSEAVLGLVRDFDTAGKPVAFICHAGWVPISAKSLKARRATSVGAVRGDMVNAGVDWVDEATVVDGNLISARTPADLGPWMKALLAALG